jgi:hypothetical protein
MDAPVSKHSWGKPVVDVPASGLDIMGTVAADQAPSLHGNVPERGFGILRGPLAWHTVQIQEEVGDFGQDRTFLKKFLADAVAMNGARER